MSKEMKHTPTPWLLTLDGMNGKNIDLDEMVFFGCDLGNNTKENAKHIVKCVNENEALHTRIKELEDWITLETQSPSQKMCDVLSKVFNKN